MNRKSSAHYQREFRRRLREQGLVKKEVWILPENAKQLAKVEKRLRQPQTSEQVDGDQRMTTNANAWTTISLFRALEQTELFQGGEAVIELIEGAESSIHIIMHEFGDLPVFLTVAGEQIIVEAVLWPESDVRDPTGFHEAVLRTHKYFPLSTISLDALSDGIDYYQMFGALSSTSLLDNIVFEIEVLATNVIQATEAYAQYLNVSVAQ